MLVTEKNFDQALDGFADESRLVLDTETTGIHPWQGDRMCGISLATPALEHICYFPFRHRLGRNLSQSYLDILIGFLNRRHLLLTGWNLKFDLEMLWFDGLRQPDYAEDVMLACHHLDENDKPFELKRWAANRIDPAAEQAEEDMDRLLRSLGFKGNSSTIKQYICELYPEEVEEYACDDVYYTELLRRKAVLKLAEWKTYRLWMESNRYMLELMRMEMHGFQLDLPLLRKHSREAALNAKEQYRKIAKMAGHEINLNSPKQICKWLKISSSAAAILEEMDHPGAKAILSFRAWDKANSTYYKKWEKSVDDRGILHPNLNLHRVVTGRQSASDPNLHQVPRYRSEYKVKDLVVARPGNTIISVDYNQAELRVGVSVAEEENMAKLFQSAERVDIHQLVADALGIDRDAAKTINFMILYGGGAEKLARKLGIPLPKAKAYLQKYHTEYWHFRYASNYWATRARHQKYIRLWTGRVRHFDHPLANPKDAFNSLVQGGVAEMLRLSILWLGKVLWEYDTHMLLQIHDQILFEAPEERVTEVVPIIREAMERFDHWMIPPKVDVKVGQRWSELTDYKEERIAA